MDLLGFLFLTGFFSMVGYFLLIGILLIHPRGKIYLDVLEDYIHDSGFGKEKD